MERFPVVSSQLVSIGYDRESHVLDLEFRNGIYRYADVPETLYISLNAAPSKGRFFAKVIKGKYTTTKLRNEATKLDEELDV